MVPADAHGEEIRRKALPFAPMTAPGNGILPAVLLIAFTISTGYAAGRIHQWYRTSLERDQAYREGYDTATRSLFGLAARLIRPRRGEKGAVRGTATVSPSLAASRAVRAESDTRWGPAPRAAHEATDLGSATTVIDAVGRHKLLDELAQVPVCRQSSDHTARTKAPNTRHATRPWATPNRGLEHSDGTSLRPAWETAQSRR
jgi:hypothetical protein